MGGTESGKQRERRQKKSSHTNHGNKATKAVITECAWAASRTKDTFISSRYKRLAGRRGKKRALVATGNQLLKIVYHILKDKTHYKELGADYVDERRKSHLIKHHLDALKELGVDMTETKSA